nr:hypothetical protein BaRGS_003302 [Batillaria attramentaria]
MPSISQNKQNAQGISAEDDDESASGEDKAETEDDNPYKSLPPTSSENSDSEKESRQQVKKIKAMKKKSEDKKAKSEIKSPRQVKEPNGQVSTPTKKGSQHEEDMSDDSSEMEMADRVKMSPRKRKKKLKDKENATATSTSSSKARKKDNSSSPAVRSQKIVKPRYSLNTYFTSDDILSENSEENNNDNDDDDGDGDEDDDDHSAGLRTNGNAAAAVSQESELPKSKPKKKETTPDILKKRTPASGSETTQQSEKKTPGSSPGTTHRIGKNTTLSSSGTTPEQEKNTSGSPRTSLKTGEKTSGNSSRTPKQAQQDVGGETRVLPECVLVIPLDVVKFQPVSATVRAHLAEELSVDDQHVHDWTSVAPLPLPAGCMIHYFADIALHVSLAMKKERDWASFGQLLVDHDTIKRKFQDDYLQKVGLYVDDLLDDVINTIKKTLHVTLRKAAERNCAMVDADFRVDFDPLEADCVSQLEVELDQQKVSMGCSKADAKSLVLLFHKMDKAVVNFELYLQRVLKRSVNLAG